MIFCIAGCCICSWVMYGPPVNGNSENHVENRIDGKVPDDRRFTGIGIYAHCAMITGFA